MSNNLHDKDSIPEQLQDLEKQIQNLDHRQQAEDAFIDAANDLFNKNIQAFTKYFPDIAEKFAKHDPSEKFNLFLTPSGQANLVDYDTGVPIYGDTPIEQCHKQVDEILKQPIIGRVDHSAISSIKNETGFKHITLMQNIGKIYDEAKATLPKNERACKKMPSMIIFGVGLGYFLDRLIEQVTASYITILEPNEDYFFASLFTFDWAQFLNKVDLDGSFLYISVGVSEQEMYQSLYDRASQIGAFSISTAVFYQHYPSKLMNELIKEFKTNFHRFFMGWGFFDDALLSIAHTVQNFKKPVSILNPKTKGVGPELNFPVFIVANGPSLDNDVAFIRENQHKALIVACNSATTALLKEGIIPDFHVALERTKATEDLLTTFISEELRQKINLLVLNVMYPKVLDLFGWCGVALKGNEAGTSLFHISEFIKHKRITSTLGYSNPLVGNTALSFFGSMDFKSIYLFGADNGYKDPNHHHSKNSYYYSKSGETVYEPLKMGGELHVEGNFGGIVTTDHFMHTGKVQMERFIDSKKDADITVFNCSDGTKVEGAFPLHSEDIMFEDSNFSKEQVINFVKNKVFTSSNNDTELESFLDFDEFDEMCHVMAEILEEPVSNRGEALEQILKSLRYLFSFKQHPRYTHFYLLMEGESLYVTSVLLSTLYNFGDDEEIMPLYLDARQLWADFIKEAPDEYRARWNELSDYSFDYSQSEV
ncbi:DUF115 domain-containing protein [Pseudoalteromonas sp. SMS1]|uniref:motility associated factor glycosyltransferase family protein n=1 Tax=Pseudoalteromonas sp. SMS1 TaxID=2908894 RepID=UPI001F484499|nr:6-hydroxymethylpterin diphosphokinase MptE-like protein [Pseudoalteromonas sp. SMS1]MCF2859363.1 DUF115 domain-containing protein [Pseudoalteromonas sp. SMS1]